VGLSWRIGPGGLLDFGRINASQARLDVAELTALKSSDDIARQVVESYTRVRSLSDQIAASRQSLSAASETLRLTRQRKQLGVGIVLEDIQAQQELVRGRADYLTAVAEFNKAQYVLGKVIGSL
jgi:outer membrane protein TolC